MPTATGLLTAPARRSRRVPARSASRPRGKARRYVAELPDSRILVLSPLAEADEAPGASRARGGDLLPRDPEGLAVHVKVDTGMGRYGMSPEEAAGIDPARVVGVMSHLATADEPDGDFVRAQLDAFAAVAERFPGATRHVANSRPRSPSPTRALDAVRCGVALYGLSPFGRRSEGARPGAGSLLAELRRQGEGAAKR